MGTIVDNTYRVLDDFKDKRAKLNAELKETLARSQSLRKKDFDRIVNGILLSQEEKEKEVKQNLKNFIQEQKKEAGELRDALRKGEVEGMKKAQIGIEKGIAEVKGLLRNFCEQQKGLTEKLRELLTKRKDLKIKDFKDMIRNLSQDAKFAQTLTRRKEVKRMGLSDVATDIKALGQDMASSHVDRNRMIEALQNEVRDMINTFQNEHAERKTELHEMLESFTENLHKGVHKFMNGVHSENAQQRAEVNNLLASFQEHMKGVHSEIAQQRVEVNDLLASFQAHMKGVRKENAQARREVDKLLEGFRKEHKLRQNEIGRLAAAVKEMWATVARAKGGAKKVSAHSFARAEERKPVRKGKKKPKKVQSLSTR